MEDADPGHAEKVSGPNGPTCNDIDPLGTVFVMDLALLDTIVPKLPPSRIATLAQRKTARLDPETRTEPAPGVRLANRYEFLERIGSGGRGDVWRARHLIINRQFAIKVQREDGPMNDQAIAEGRAAAAVSHPNVVEIIDVGSLTPRRGFVVMELLHGMPLRAALRGAPVPWTRARTWLRQALEALAAIHAAGIVHGDISENNLFIRADDSLCIIDFGLASPREARRDQTQIMPTGTPASMSPEQVRGRPLDPRSDLYSLACVAYQMLTGTPVFDGSPMEQLSAHALRQPSPPGLPSDVPADVAALLRACLAKDPDQRPSAASEILAALPETSEPSATRRPKHWLMASAAAAIAAVFVVLTVLSVLAARRELLVLKSHAAEASNAVGLLDVPGLWNQEKRHFDVDAGAS